MPQIIKAQSNGIFFDAKNKKEAVIAISIFLRQYLMM